jgi:hypothetical protein
MTQPYRFYGNRCSLLPVSFYCPLAGRLSAEHGAGREARMSQAVHARFAGVPEAQKLYESLDPDERAEVDTWHKPSTVTWLEHGETVVLDYESAEKEVPVGLDKDGNFVGPDRECMTAGTLDFAWVREVAGMRVAYVADMKKTRWTTSDGPASLQVAAYGFAYASKEFCDAFVTGIWILEDGAWQWSSEMIVLGTYKADELWGRVRSAALNTSGEVTTGAHCRSCWGRKHCPEYFLPFEANTTELAKLNDVDSLAPDELGAIVLMAQAAKEIAELALKHCKEAVRRGAEARCPKTGKVWRMAQRQGRESALSVKELRARLGAEAEQYIKRGEPYEQADWVKA